MWIEVTSIDCTTRSKPFGMSYGPIGCQSAARNPIDAPHPTTTTNRPAQIRSGRKHQGMSRGMEEKCFVILQFGQVWRDRERTRSVGRGPPWRNRGVLIQSVRRNRFGQFSFPTQLGRGEEMREMRHFLRSTVPNLVSLNPSGLGLIMPPPPPPAPPGPLAPLGPPPEPSSYVKGEVIRHTEIALISSGERIPNWTCRTFRMGRGEKANWCESMVSRLRWCEKTAVLKNGRPKK